MQTVGFIATIVTVADINDHHVKRMVLVYLYLKNKDEGKCYPQKLRKTVNLRKKITIPL